MLSLNRTTLLEYFDNTEGLCLSQGFQEHKAVELAVLNIARFHRLDRFWQRHGTCLQYIQRQLDVLVHLDWVITMLYVHKLTHLGLVWPITGDLSDKIAKCYSILDVFETGYKQTARIVE